MAELGIEGGNANTTSELRRFGLIGFTAAPQMLYTNPTTFQSRSCQAFQIKRHTLITPSLTHPTQYNTLAMISSSPPRAWILIYARV